MTPIDTVQSLGQDSVISTAALPSTDAAAETNSSSAEDDLMNYYAIESRRRYSNTVEGIISLGQCLFEAKSKLSPAAWKQFANTNLSPVSYTVANRLLSISKNDNIADRGNWAFLPLGWNVLYEISLLDDEQFKKGIRENLITPKARLDDIRKLRNKPPHSARRKQVTRAPEPTDVKQRQEEIEDLSAILTVNNPARTASETTSALRDGDAQTPLPGRDQEGVTAERDSIEPHPQHPVRRRSYRLTIFVQADARDKVEELKRAIEQDLRSSSFEDPKVEIDEAE